MPRIVDSETYLNATEAAKFMEVSLITFNKKFAPRVTVFADPKRANAKLYKQTELEPLKAIRPHDSSSQK